MDIKEAINILENYIQTIRMFDGKEVTEATQAYEIAIESMKKDLINQKCPHCGKEPTL